MSLFVDIHKKWEGFSLDIKLEAEDEVLGLLGESGSGKSMTLRCIAGIVTPDSGRIVVNGRTLYDSESGINLTPRQRGVGLMFQNYALFPNMTVEQNIGAGVRERGRERTERVAFYTALLRLTGLEKRYPRQLSGGQQQRVAIARMMAGAPAILLLDEPFSSLDERLRQEIDPEFTAALAAFDGTVLYVSHDIGEIYRFCEKTAMIHGGAVFETDSTKKLFSHPQTVMGARMLCCKNIAAIERMDGQPARAWGMSLPASAQAVRHVGIFGDDVEISLVPTQDSAPAVLESVGDRPRYQALRLRVEHDGTVITASCGKTEADALVRGAAEGRVYLRLPPDKLLYLRD